MARFQYEKQPHTRYRLFIPICVFLAVIVLFFYGISSLSDNTARRQRESLENALTRSITYCYAVEGAYPESLEYLKENYGLTYDESRFYVDYRDRGENILPDVTILER